MAKPKSAKKNPTIHRPKKADINKRFLIIAGCIAGILIIIVAVLIYGARVYSDPTRTFWAMVNNNLASPGITKQMSQQASDGSVEDLIQITFSPSPQVHYLKKVTDKSSHLTLEGIGLPKVDYQRYSHIDRSGKQADYSSIYKLWLKQDNPQIFGNSIFGPFFFGNLKQPQRADVISRLKDTYQVKLENKKSQNGRQTYTYIVTIKMQKYAIAANTYAKALGLPGDNQFNPSDYQANEQSQLLVTVDMLSRQLASVTYKNLNTSERYSSYGISAAVELPAKTVNTQQFQEALKLVVE